MLHSPNKKSPNCMFRSGNWPLAGRTETTPLTTQCVEMRRLALDDQQHAVHDSDEPANGLQPAAPALRYGASSRFIHVFERKPTANYGISTDLN